MRHVVRAILLRHKLEHLATPRVVEIHVDIGHRDSVGVQEPLEQQVVLNRVDVRDAKRVGNGRARRGAAPWAHPHAHLARVRDVVVYDEEVTGETHRLYDAKLEIDALHDLGGRRVAPTPLHALVDERLEVIGLKLDPEDLLVPTKAFKVLRLVLGIELGS